MPAWPGEPRMRRLPHQRRCQASARKAPRAPGAQSPATCLLGLPTRLARLRRPSRAAEAAAADADKPGAHEANDRAGGEVASQEVGRCVVQRRNPKHEGEGDHVRRVGHRGSQAAVAPGLRRILHRDRGDGAAEG